MFVLYTVILAGDLGPTPLDRELLDLGDRLRAQMAVDAAKVVSAFGALPICAAAVLATAILLATRRRWPELLVLVGGFVLIVVAVHVAKAGIDRPRPAAPLVATDGSSFPSGHAAYATAWIAVAFVLTRRLALVTGATLTTAAMVLAAAIGASRIYLRAHYWSDVAGGWGLGLGIFGSLAGIALIVEYMRHNEGERVSPPERPVVARAEQ